MKAMLNRRQLIKGGALLTLSATLPMIEGCSVDIKALINTVLASAQAVIKVAQPNAVWLPQLQNAIIALEQAEAKWQGGSPAQIVIAALDTLESVLAVIPLTAQYSPLIDILVAGIEAVITAFGPQPVVSARPGRVNLHRGRVALVKPRKFPFPQNYQNAYKDQWNAKAKELNLPQAQI